MGTPEKIITIQLSKDQLEKLNTLLIFSKIPENLHDADDLRYARIEVCDQIEKILEEK